jgi:hypothetical protein
VASTTMLDGAPWSQYVETAEAYLRGQGGSVGSGALGGWGEANLGGPFANADRTSMSEVLAEIKELRRELERRAAEPHLFVD